jgi:uncharacterized membrane protein required for colicin V production
MVSLAVIFYIFIGLFTVIGAVRGWAKEILVTSSVILAMFLIFILENYMPYTKDVLVSGNTDPIEKSQLWIRIIILGFIAFFGYQTPNIGKLGGARFAREKLQDTLLGMFLGALNGYLIVGTIWAFLNQAGYPFDWIITPLPDNAVNLLEYLPPQFIMQEPIIFIAVGLIFIFILVVFI